MNKRAFTIVELPPSLNFKRASLIPNNNVKQGFTIVELLVVIVVIGILAAITIVSYTGLSSKATVASLQSDLSSAKKQLALYQVEHSTFPISLTADGNKYCPTGGTEYCFKTSTGNTFTYTSISPYSTFSLTNINTNSNTIYTVTNDSGPTVIPTVTIGSQVWMQYNLNVGTMITGATAQTNNSTLEKYCYNNTESNCTTYGGLYQWNEAMQYVTTAGAQGICPASFHIPTDAEYKTLEIFLGMSQATADTTSWRGTNQGAQLKTGGSSGLSIPLASIRLAGGFFDGLLTRNGLWSSSESGATAWYRYMDSDHATVSRDTNAEGYGFSVRCLKN